MRRQQDTIFDLPLQTQQADGAGDQNWITHNPLKQPITEHGPFMGIRYICDWVCNLDITPATGRRKANFEPTGTKKPTTMATTA